MAVREDQLWLQFLLAAGGTLGFVVSFGIPRKHYAACAVDGAVGWVVYEAVVLLGADSVLASLIAVIPLTVLARCFAVSQRAPVTVFLLCGIFPLVPGASIYYTAVYFIQGQNELFVQSAFHTLKIAVALALGISLVLGVPKRRRREAKK